MKNLFNFLIIVITYLMSNFITIAIDGTAASGKTTTSKRVADKYSMMMVSTGLYYRILTLLMLQKGVKNEDLKAVSEFLCDLNVETKITGNVSNMSVDGYIFEEDELRTKEINSAVATYSAVQIVREFLLNYQRSQSKIAKDNGFLGLIMEGRDITSVIFPDADLRFFLEASERERSIRRKNDDEADCVTKRDKLDGERTVCKAGVMKIDTGENDLNAVVGIISAEIEKFLKK